MNRGSNMITRTKRSETSVGLWGRPMDGTSFEQMTRIKHSSTYYTSKRYFEKNKEKYTAVR